MSQRLATVSHCKMDTLPFNVCEAVIGVKSAYARKIVTDAGLIPRTVKEDGQAYITTQDFNKNRVNLSVVDDIIVRATIG